MSTYIAVQENNCCLTRNTAPLREKLTFNC